MAGDWFVKRETAKQRKHEGAKKTFPGLLRANVRHHQMPPNRAPSQIRAHVREFSDRNQVQHVELAGELAAARPRSEIHNFSDEIVKPKHVEHAEQCVSHRLQRLVVSKPGKHLPPEYRQQKKKQDSDFEII